LDGHSRAGGEFSGLGRKVKAVGRRYLPQGGTLSEDRWWKRHRGVLGLLWAHAAAIPVYAVVRGLPFGHLLVESLVLPVAALMASSGRLPRRARTLIAAAGLMTSSGLLVHLSGGLIEMHFHFFIMVVVVSLYQDWTAFLAAIGYVLIHHGTIGAIDPRSVFNHPAALNHPWKWAAIHALFIAGISAASLVAWRLNETLLGQRRAVEERLRKEARIVENLNDVGRMLVADLDLTAVVQRVIDAATERTSAQFGAFFYNVADEKGESYLLHALAGAPAESFANFPMPRNTQIFAPTFSGQGIVRVDDVTQDPRYGQNPPYNGMPAGHLPVRSYLAVPVVSRSGVIGGLFFAHEEPGRFTDADERIVIGVAAHAAVAIENAKLYEAERRARTEEEHARRRLAIIAEASRSLSASLDLEAVLRNLGSLVVPAIADNCVIDFLQDDGTLRRVHLAIEPRAAELHARMGAEPPDPRADDHPAVHVVRTGKSLLVEDVPDDAIERLIDGEEFRQLTRELRPRSAAIVPIIGSEGVLGALTLATTAASGRRLGADDLTLLEELARRTATATENARRYQTQREAAQTLQHSLLPDSLPELPTLRFGASYQPGKRGTEVGGDWYDVVAVPDGAVGLVMGDVVGRGIEAASLMGQIRNALRAYAFLEPNPGLVLEQLNALFSGWSAIDQMATMLYAVFDVETGEVCVANAGHLPPVIRKSDGSTVLIDDLRGTPLGATSGARYATRRFVLDAGDTLLLYTDGLVEDRRTPLDDGIEQLRQAVARPIDDLQTYCDEVVERVTAQRDVDDDVAVLAMHYAPFGDQIHLTLPADPWILRPLRSALRRWLTEAGATPDEMFRVLVATSEACANAIRHPGGRRNGEFDVDADRNGRIRISVTDRGRWRASTGRGSGGRGLKLMHELIDDVSITKGPPETIVSLTHRLSDPTNGTQ
jgi:GAF domain-containing protein/anti-sigma regulatory factor (Ser/Thr protein kinase)